MKPLLTFLFTCVTGNLHAQESIFLIKAGTKVNDVIPAKEQYRYAGFSNGKVVFRDGTISEGKMNYNCLVDEMHFITTGGDTLALNDEATVTFISISEDTFYFDQGFVRLVKSCNGLKLGVKQGFKAVDVQNKAAAYDLMSSTSSVLSLSSVDDGRVSHQLVVKGEMQVSKFSHYYLGNRYNKFVLVSRRNLDDLFPECRPLLQEFCKRNKIDLTRQRDVERVVCFLGSKCLNAEF